MIDITFEDANFRVTDVSEEHYILSFSSGVSGTIKILLLSGELSGTSSATFYVRKDNLGIEKISNFHIEGTVMGGSFTVDVKEINQNISGVASPYNFPTEVGKSWTVPATDVWIEDLDVSMPKSLEKIVGKIENWTFTATIGSEHTVTCKKIEYRNGYHDAYFIENADRKLWYSPSAGNAVEVHYKNVRVVCHGEEKDWLDTTLQDLHITLKETNYNTPPEKPSPPSGPTEGRQYVKYTYNASTTDPENSSVRFKFDWGDGTTSGWTEFVGSGEQISVTHAWTEPGTYEVRVKAQDAGGLESEWSDPIVVTIIENLPPTVPGKPKGPTEVEVGCEYSYEATEESTDPEGDQIRYGWDWDGDLEVDEWTELGAPPKASHSWRKAGTFEVRVKSCR